MPKLFTGIEPVKVHYSAEEFVDYYAKANVVACEAVTDYLFAIKDKVNTLVTGTFSNTDVTLLDATANRFQVQSILKRVHFSELAHEVVNTPERFHGDRPPYLYVDKPLNGTKTRVPRPYPFSLLQCSAKADANISLAH